MLRISVSFVRRGGEVGDTSGLVAGEPLSVGCGVCGFRGGALMVVAVASVASEGRAGPGAAGILDTESLFSTPSNVLVLQLRLVCIQPHSQEWHETLPLFLSGFVQTPQVPGPG